MKNDWGAAEACNLDYRRRRLSNGIMMFIGPKNEESGLSSKRTQLAEVDKASIENARNSWLKHQLIKKGTFVDVAGGDIEP